jgi:hypothetical protein
MNRFSKIVDVDIMPVEIVLMYVSVAFGLKLLSPETTFDSSNAFIVMSKIAPEWAWGGAMLLTGLTRLIGIYRHSLVIRRAVSFVSLLLWTSISISFFLSNPSGTGPITFSTFAFASAWCLLVMSKDTHHAGATRK